MGILLDNLAHLSFVLQSSPGGGNVTERVVLWCLTSPRRSLWSAHTSVFQATAMEGGETSVKVRKYLDESKVEKQGGCLQSAGKRGQG